MFWPALFHGEESFCRWCRWGPPAWPLAISCYSLCPVAMVLRFRSAISPLPPACLLLGFSGGLYDVPLQAYLQYHSPEKTRGSIFAAINFMTFSGTLAASGYCIF